MFFPILDIFPIIPKLYDWEKVLILIFLFLIKQGMFLYYGLLRKKRKKIYL